MRSITRPRRRSRKSSGSKAGRPGAGSLIVLRSGSGELLHVALPAVTSTLRSTVARLRLAGELPDRLGIVSAIRGEGVTYVSRSLALVLANDTGTNVCIVDLNWSAPSRREAEAEAGAGLASVLRGGLSLDEALVPTADPALSILPAGVASADEIPVFAAGSALRTVLDELAHRFEHLVLDLPAVLPASEALTLAGNADSLAVVVRQGVTSEGQVKAALEHLEGLPVLGVILNAFATDIPSVIMRRVPTS